MVIKSRRTKLKGREGNAKCIQNFDKESSREEATLKI
jgi:hypothetical protein